MNTLEIVIISLVATGGILAATFTTICCMVQQACEERDRQLFDAYVHSPRDLETWLVRGALEHIQHVLSIEDLKAVPVGAQGRDSHRASHRRLLVER